VDGVVELLRQLDELYVPRDERTLRHLQRRTEDLDRRVRRWAQDVLDILPKGTALIDDEVYILGLFLAQQRRLNLEIDAENPEDTWHGRISRYLPFMMDPETEWETTRAAHRTVAARLESDIDRACQFFCRDRNLAHMSDQAIDWRVSIRYLAQELQRLTANLEIRRDYYASPQRFEIALVTRDLAADIVERRRVLVTTGDRITETIW
jgi:hypothetical protein